MGTENIKAIFFDMDGTLVDSESLTGIIIDFLLTGLEIEHDSLDYEQFHGATWKHIEQEVNRLFPESKGIITESEMEKQFDYKFIHNSPALIPGALEFFGLCCENFPTAVISSSNRECIAHLLKRMNYENSCEFYLGSEDFKNSKPHPECYLLGAKKLSLKPEECLVFEDSINGLKSAKAAKMKTIAVSYTKNKANIASYIELADTIIDDFTGLNLDFFNSL